ATCGDCAPVEVEKRLVILLNTLCVAISLNNDLLELFFAPYNDKEDINVPTISDITSSPQIISKFAYLHKPESRFLIFSLLIPFVHREGAIGQQARDSLLLIMALSRKHENIGAYIAEHSNFCPVLATGLSGLYSSLPRKLSNDALIIGDWHRITSEDINDTPELKVFLNSLEFCNAVVHVSHPLVTNQLLEFIYQGFLVSVVGPALHQDTLNVPLEVLETSPKFLNSLEEMIATTAYLELFLRSINESSLLQVFLKFICVEKFDDQRILHTLIGRIHANSKLGLVTIVLFQTLLDLNCEDVLLELVLKYLMSFEFVGKENLETLSDVKNFDICAQKFLSLIPDCCFATLQTSWPISSSSSVSDSINDQSNESNFLTSTGVVSHFTLHPLQNYVEYLNDAHNAIKRCAKGCRFWSHSYGMFNKEEPALSPLPSIRLDNSPLDSGIYLNATSGAPNDSNLLNVPDAQMTLSNVQSDEKEITNNMANPNFFESQLIGPFLSSIFDRLSKMPSNDVYTNLQLTGLLSRLAIYPQPILRSFLLNNQLTLNAKCRSLWSILHSIQQQLEAMAANIDNFFELLAKAKNFFKSREDALSELLGSRPDSSSRKQSTSSSEVFINIDTPKEKTESKRRSIASLLFRTRAQSTPISQPTLKAINNGSGYKYINKRKQSHADESKEADERQNMLRNQNTVLSLLVMEEFLKELSAIAQEHFILDYNSRTIF
ncbi:hypothetical protein B4U79_04576, partial [Dinothrombium tinctorium]